MFEEIFSRFFENQSQKVKKTNPDSTKIFKVINNEIVSGVDKGRRVALDAWTGRKELLGPVNDSDENCVIS
jgi:hypothetical protein